MPGVATWDGPWWPRGRAPSTPSSAAGTPILGVPVLSQQIGALGYVVRIIVEIAWGANLSADPSTWGWTDITRDVRVAGNGKIITQHGRVDEQSQTQPASAQFTLLNINAAYSKGPVSPNWPNVTKNTPLRIRSRRATRDPVIEWQGYTTAFDPIWDKSGNYATVQVKAHGILRRLGQGNAPLKSVLTRAIPALPNLVAYWPCEDGSSATQIAGGLPGQAPMLVEGTVNFASNSNFASTKPIVTISTGGRLTGYVPARPGTGSVQARVLVSIPSTGTTDQAPLLRLFTTGTVYICDVFYVAGGLLGVAFYDRNAVSLLNTTYGFGINGKDVRLSFEIYNSGGDIKFNVSTVDAHTGIFGGISGTVTAHQVGHVTGVVLSAFQNATGIGFGQVTVENQISVLTTLGQQLLAYNGEKAEDRITRLCAENSIPLEVEGDSQQAMGPQSVDTLLNLLRAAETVSNGVLCDGVGPGLKFVGPSAIESRSVDLTLDAAIGDVALPFVPLDDDPLVRNQWTVTRAGGSMATVSDQIGPMGVPAVGLYDSSATENLARDAQAADHAGWRVHQGTAEGYRYPTFTTTLHNSPQNLVTWIGMRRILNRVDVINLAGRRAQHPAGTVSQLIQGYSQSIDQFLWTITANCSPYDPWRVGVLAADTGDNGEFVIHLDSDGCQVAADTPAGSTTMTVSTPSGPLWTTTADDFPLTLSAAGLPVVVTGCSAATGTQQTMTVDPTTVTRDIPSGIPLVVYQQPVPRLSVY